LQNRHLIAAARMLSPHTGHAFVSSLICVAPYSDWVGWMDGCHGKHD
jgi:hypothetical protein